MTFDSWLGNVGALNTDGTITLTNVAASINTVNAPTLQWIYGGGSIGDSGIDRSHEVHVLRHAHRRHHGSGRGRGPASSTAERPSSPTCTPAAQPSGDLPGSARPGPHAQEKALEFLFFDLAACVRDETVPQVMPPPPK